MKKILLSLLLLATTCSLTYAQTIETKLAAWAKTNPVEKLYLHLDRESYFAGQTIWLKGYFMAGLIPSGQSSSLYVELVNSENDVILRNIFPVYYGTTIGGQIDIPENLVAGTYQIRAYSSIMLNQPGFVFHKRVSIWGKEDKKKNNDIPGGKSQLLFFPEGGNLVKGLLNIVAFKAVDKYGMPLSIEGEIKSETGEVVTSFKSQHDGMGSFPIIPLPGGSYFATLKGTEEKYPLPQSTDKGIAFSVRNTAKGKQFRIQYNSTDEAFKPAYLVGQMENQVLFKHPINGDKKEITGVIPTTDFFSGILQLTVFNKDEMPLAERLTFINNKDYVLPATLKVDTLNAEARKRNRFSIALSDTIIGNFSVSVTDADSEIEPFRSQNIYSWFLLNSDLRGYIHNPAYYFNNQSDSTQAALDLVMMTNGWTRFKWTDVAQNKLPPAKYKDPGYITLSGQILLEGTKKPLANRDVIMMRSAVDTTVAKRGATTLLQTDSTGHFKLDSLFFTDKNKILFSEVRGNKSKFIRVKLDADSLNRKFGVEPIPMPQDSSAVLKNNAIVNAYDEYIKAQGLVLENVIVKARQKTEVEKLDEQYASGLFSGGINSRTIDLRNEVFGGDIFQYLQGRVAGLTVSGTPGNYVLNYRGGGLGGGNVALFLDEMPTDAMMIEGIPVAELAFIKLMPNTVATAGGGTALAIYRKKGADLSAAMESPTDIVNYNGYTVTKEFYNPDYDKQPDNSKADKRMTLNWNPAIFLAEVNPTIPVIFYNNDQTKRFKIVAEGVTNDGRMLMIEKIIEPGGN
ncbi:hypothetical protein ACTJIJ_14150 [Niabella sp. 22666]|uniref:hypothetical protein n=1 Tax=Niabella sp. 22666 TaxID=3453954 RepID=UPI003F856CFA